MQLANSLENEAARRPEPAVGAESAGTTHGAAVVIVASGPRIGVEISSRPIVAAGLIGSVRADTGIN